MSHGDELPKVLNKSQYDFRIFEYKYFIAIAPHNSQSIFF
jgi:hypothetical protein